ncbi:MAG: DUF393 domain-containing protein [Alphaproteobacteria bacterium]|nr:DUF393 domain-containing protein [Alphaproteobacteria bacterium]
MVPLRRTVRPAPPVRDGRVADGCNFPRRQPAGQLPRTDQGRRHAALRRRLGCVLTPGSHCSRDQADPVTVFYDGSCPLCSREITFYRRRRGGGEIAWVDVSACQDSQLPGELTRQSALARFHVQTEDGHLVSGAAAFAALWNALPSFRLAGRTARFAPVAWILERAYRAFLPVRPYLQRFFKG